MPDEQTTRQPRGAPAALLNGLAILESFSNPVEFGQVTPLGQTVFKCWFGASWAGSAMVSCVFEMGVRSNILAHTMLEAAAGSSEY